MKTKSILLISFAMILSFSTAAQIGNLKSLGKKVLNEKTDQAKQAAEEKANNANPVNEQGAEQNLESISQIAGKQTIIFSKTPIEPANPGESLNTFNAGDQIYALAMLPKSLQELYGVGATSKVDVEVFIYEVKPPLYSYQKEPREEQFAFASMKVSGNALTNKYLVVDIVPSPDNTTAYGNPDIKYKEFGKKYDGPVNFAESFGKLEPGKHKFKVIVKCNYEKTAVGSFTLAGDNFGTYGSISQKLNEFAMNAASASALMPKAEKSDPVLEKQMIAAFKGSNDWANGRFDATETLKINIYDKDWYIRRHNISGAILHRYIRAAIAVKLKSGLCAYYIVTFQEDYVSNKFQPLRYDGSTEKVMIDCRNIGK